MTFGPFRIDPTDQSLWRGPDRIALPPKTFALLHYLATNPERLVTKDELLDELWPGTYVADGALKVRVRELRSALGDEADTPRLVETVHRRGYRFVAKVERAGARGVPAVASVVPLSSIDREPEGAHATYGPRPALAPIGREPELAALRAHLDSARAGERQIVFVTASRGPSGSSPTLWVDSTKPSTFSIARAR